MSYYHHKFMYIYLRMDQAFPVLVSNEICFCIETILAFLIMYTAVNPYQSWTSPWHLPFLWQGCTWLGRLMLQDTFKYCSATVTILLSSMAPANWLFNQRRKQWQCWHLGRMVHFSKQEVVLDCTEKSPPDATKAKLRSVTWSIGRSKWDNDLRKNCQMKKTKGSDLKLLILSVLLGASITFI